MSTDFQAIDLQVHEGVAEIILQRPERKNALTGPLVSEIRTAVARCASDDSCRVLLFRGAGGVFCSGLDLKEFNAEPLPEWVAGFQQGWRALHVELFELDMPVVCALERYAINAGAALALSSDFLVAGTDAFLQVGEVIQGRPAPMNLAWLRLRFGDAITRKVVLLGRRIPGPELERLGIAFEVVAADFVLSRAREFAAELAGLPPAGIAATKRALRALDLPGGPNAWFDIAARAVATARPGGPIPSLKR